MDCRRVVIAGQLLCLSWVTHKSVSIFLYQRLSHSQFYAIHKEFFYLLHHLHEQLLAGLFVLLQESCQSMQKFRINVDISK